ncbi:trans-sulfuration enzyme family protein [Treponema primitia]|uniref:trans-sulfuration enzyme family protein n=1 Tax=Treponema primitia TaxID=88058 RepID=UPI00025552C3|nr:PLP-dependent aspartate aminotransferase family protein [Treponema primitia]
MDIQTLLVQGHIKPDEAYNAVTLPIYLTTTYHSPKFGERGKYAYSRGANPTREYLESLVARLEGGSYGFALSSGMTAIAAALAVLKAGDKVLITQNVYGGTVDLLNTFFKDFGLTYELVDTSDVKKLEDHFDKNTRAILIETPSNPLLDITDIGAVSKAAKNHGAITIVDNTFMSPYLQLPLELGADIVVESATKFLSGHSDVIAGTVVTNDAALAGKIRAFQRLVGGISQPFDAYLLVRGIKTLSVRIDRQVENTAGIVEFLRKSPAVEKIYYPGLPEHPGYAVNQRQAKSPGSILSFLLKPGFDIGRFFDSLKLITVGASLGSVETLIQHPATGSHSGFSPEQRKAAGIRDNLIRLSVGIENAGDLIEDLHNALGASKL